ncbi:MAG: isocitrate/isopropylmalate dehydrogenase family protein [Candidatus Margulisbacteria bacterium]|nr:isocitrate/isopropylmalate dehydrogenase family protein [Candidatus Margulisiibacteriota bacterium]
MSKEKQIDDAVQHFRTLLTEQVDRVKTMKKDEAWVDYNTISPIIIGVCWGDGIGEEISNQAQHILEHMLNEDVKNGSVEFRIIKGLTIENRVEHKTAIPDDVLAELKQCHVILKGPTTTPQKGDKWPNIESANVAMRRELDLFACVRPVRVPEHNIDWTFFRENTEGAYVLGSRGIDVTEDISFDFKVITQPGAERIIKLAFEYAKQNNKKKVTVVTKSNVVKTTDGRFSETAHQIAKQYVNDGIILDEWYIDIMTAKLLDPARRHEFQVMVLPNLYGDILTDEAGQIQGGVGTAGSSNIGKRYAMFEAIHGSAPRMVNEGRAKYADPSSMIKAAAMLLAHIGKTDASQKLGKALEICSQFEKRLTITGRENGSTAADYAAYVLEWVSSPKLNDTYEEYLKKSATSVT